MSDPRHLGTAAVLLGALLLGCAGPDAAPTPDRMVRPLPTDSGTASFNEMALQGRLTVDAQGCVAVVVGDDGRTLRPLWSAGYTARVSDGVAEVLDPAGEVVAREGQRVDLGGGPRGDVRAAACLDDQPFGINAANLLSG